MVSKIVNFCIVSIFGEFSWYFVGQRRNIVARIWCGIVLSWDLEIMNIFENKDELFYGWKLVKEGGQIFIIMRNYNSRENGTLKVSERFLRWKK